jgi:hypothetical protein
LSLYLYYELYLSEASENLRTRLGILSQLLPYS